MWSERKNRPCHFCFSPYFKVTCIYASKRAQTTATWNLFVEWKYNVFCSNIFIIDVCTVGHFKHVFKYQCLSVHCLLIFTRLSCKEAVGLMITSTVCEVSWYLYSISAVSKRRQTYKHCCEFRFKIYKQRSLHSRWNCPLLFK